MSFELIMLSGFLGTALLAMLPATPRQVARERLRRQRCQRDKVPRKPGRGDKKAERLPRREAPTEARNFGGMAA
jgi:hypothetical protein